MLNLKTISTIVLGLGLATSAFAGTILNSPYDGQNPGNAQDVDGVIGYNGQFDIQSVSFTNITNSNVTVQIDFNYNFGDSTLSAFQIAGITLNPGDLLFNSGGQMWGVALANHPGFTAGNLYSVDGFLTAKQVLNNPQGVSYNPNAQVWMNNDGHQSNVGSGTSSSTNIGGDEVQTTLSFAPSAPFFTAINNGVFTQFGAATCGNDYVSGNIGLLSTPEPGGLLLLGACLIGLGAFRRKKNVKQS